MTILYIIQSITIPNKFYLGITDRKEERLEEHNRGQTQSTKKFRPWRVIYTEDHTTKSEAMKRERYLKSVHGYKERIEIIENSSSVG